MNDAELKKLAHNTGIRIKKIAEWHLQGQQHYMGSGGKHRRPKGTLSVSDIMVQYGVPHKTVQEWRRAGLKTRSKGKMVLVRKDDLEEWMQEHRFVQRSSNE